MSSGTRYLISFPVLLLVSTFLSNCDSGSESDSQAETNSLHQTVKQDDINATIQFLIQGTDINTRDEEENTPLHHAAEYASREMVELLLEKGASINAKNKYQMTPLHYACVAGKLDIAILLVEKGAVVDSQNHGGWTPLFNAAMEGNYDTTKFLIDKGAVVNHQDERGNAVLHYAAGNGKDLCVKLLLEKGARPNITNKSGETPLDWVKQRMNPMQRHPVLSKYDDKYKICCRLLQKNVISGTIYYNDKPISELTDIEPDIYCNDATTRIEKRIPDIKTTYHKNTGKYQIEDVPYIPIKLKIRFLVNGNHRADPGNYQGSTSIDLTNETLPTHKSLDMHVRQTMHLISPYDNSEVKYATGEYLIHLNPIEFKWEPVVGADHYIAKITRYRSPSHPQKYGSIETIIEKNTKELSFITNLPSSVQDEHYSYTVHAYGKNGKDLGYLMRRYTNGYGWDYRFRVEGEKITNTESPMK